MELAFISPWGYKRIINYTGDHERVYWCDVLAMPSGSHEVAIWLESRLRLNLDVSLMQNVLCVFCIGIREYFCGEFERDALIVLPTTCAFLMALDPFLIIQESKGCMKNVYNQLCLAPLASSIGIRTWIFFQKPSWTLAGLRTKYWSIWCQTLVCHVLPDTVPWIGLYFPARYGITLLSQGRNANWCFGAGLRPHNWKLRAQGQKDVGFSVEIKV